MLRARELSIDGYITKSGEREISKGPSQRSSEFSLTWRGFIASLAIDGVATKIIDVFRNSPLIELPIKNDLLDVIEEYEILSQSELEAFAKGIFIGVVQALPFNVEYLDQSGLMAVMPAAFQRSRVDMSKIDQEKARNLLPVLRDPRIFNQIKSYLRNSKKQLKENLELIATVEDWLESG